MLCFVKDKQANNTNDFTTTQFLCDSCASHVALSPSQMISKLQSPQSQELWFICLCILSTHLSPKDLTVPTANTH